MSARKKAETVPTDTGFSEHNYESSPGHSKTENWELKKLPNVAWSENVFPAIGSLRQTASVSTCLQLALWSNGYDWHFFEDRLLMTGEGLWDVDISNISVKSINSLVCHVLWKFRDSYMPEKISPSFHCQSHSPPLFSLYIVFPFFPFSPLCYHFLLPLLFVLLFFLCPAHWQWKNTVDVLKAKIWYQIIFKWNCFKGIL